MDNQGVARLFTEIADLLEIKGDNPFKVRAYRNAADIVGTLPEPASGLSEEELLALPGIGKEITAKLREILETGSLRYHRSLLAEFPASVLDLLRLPGLGPKTVALLYHRLEIATVEQLEAAAAEGRLRALPRMGARKEEQILKAIAWRRARPPRGTHA